MTSTGNSRRTFLASMAGVQIAAVNAAWAAVQPGKLTFFNDAQAAEIDAVTAQIIPSDESPGAHEAHCLYFIDRALTTFAQATQPVYVRGLQDLEAKTQELYPGSARFSALSSGQQVQVLTAIEKTPFFRTVRTHTVIGFFSRPIHGGNFDKVGWKLIGYDDSLNHKPPFGYYDAL